MIRDLALALLNDDHGINAGAWRLLREMLRATGVCGDIISAVKAQDDRYFLAPADVIMLSGR